jgi:argininosuccinate lyase
LEELSLAELNGNETAVIEQDIYEVLIPQGSIASRDHVGGTAPQQVRAAIARARAQI